MSRRWWVLGGVPAAVVIAAAGWQLPQASAEPDAPAHRLALPSFHVVGPTHLQRARPAGAAARAVPAPGVRPRVPAAASAAGTTSKDQVLSVWPGVVGSVASPRPDAAIAVGPKQVLQVTDAGARVISKATGSLVGATANLNQLFNVASGPAGVTVSDPTTVYDPVGKRFLLVAVTTDNSSSDTGMVIRVSKSSSVSTSKSSWRTTYSYVTGDTVTESAPRVGVSADKVVIALAASDSGDATVAHLTVVMPKQKLYAAKSNGPKAWAGTSDASYDGQTPVVNASKQNTAFVVVPATNDFTLISYTGSATSQAPVYVKSVTYATRPLVDAPDVPQAGGDTITLPPAVLTASVSWRANALWAALTVGCTPSGDTTQRACLRLVKMSTTAPAPALAGEFTIATNGYDSFGPGVGIDSQGSPHVGFSRSNAAAAPGAVSAALVARSKSGSWTAPLTLTKGTAPFDDGQGPATAPWATRGTAAVDPTSPWDVWVAPALSTSKLTSPTPDWAASPARVSFAKNSATTRASSTKVRKGTRVTLTARLLRPSSSDGVKGLPVVLQKKQGSKWVTVGSAKTDGNGLHKWTVKVTRTTDFRTVGSAVKQKNGQGALVGSVTGKTLRVTVKK